MPDFPIAALFDLDGVIIDTESQYSTFWSHIDGLYPTGVPDFACRIKGSTLSEILSTYFPDASVQADIVERLNAHEQTMDYPLLPGAERILASLAERGIPAVLVTSSNDVKMAAVWRRHPHLRQMFSHLVTADRIARSKPDPEGYLLGARLAGARPERCVVFEDSIQGVMAGRNAGAFVVGMEGTVDAARLKPLADIVVRGFGQLDLDSLCNILKSR